MNNAEILYRAGQSIWYDNIERSLLDSGEFARMVTDGEIFGVTSNPSIFNNAIGKSDTYDPAIAQLAGRASASDIFFALAVEDIQRAADALRPVYDNTSRKDGYVSLEVDPFLAGDTAKTIEQVQRIWQLVNRPNLMVKIPATLAGIPAIEASIAAGINVNATLIFSLERYQQVMDAYLSGLRRRIAEGKPVEPIHSVASFFISRIDTKVDKLLEEKMAAHPEQAAVLQPLLGKAAIANAHLAYAQFLQTFSAEHFADIAAAGGNRQRPLWASTSTKNPAYRNVVYVDTLVAEDTVNTVPPATLTALLQELTVAPFGRPDMEAAIETIHAIETAGVSLDQVTEQLETEGVKSFADAFQTLLDTIQSRVKAFTPQIASRRTQLLRDILERKPAAWTDDQAAWPEITQRLGWLDAPWRSMELIPQLDVLKDKVQAHGYKTAVLLGMGGSSLAPEVISKVFGAVPKPEGSLALRVLDSTHPAQIQRTLDDLDPATTLFIVASKSGTTTEVRVLQAYCWEMARRMHGANAGDHFICITDPGSAVEKFGRENGFLSIINADPNVGGRFSALIAFGLVPAALIGVDIAKFLSAAQHMAEACKSSDPEQNPGAALGFAMAEQASQGQDKLMLLAQQPFSSLGGWLEQLIAESSGKAGQGILPVPINEADAAVSYPDAYTVRIHQADTSPSAADAAADLKLADAYDLAAEFYRWEFATAVACAEMGINAFDQPNVQDSKSRTQAVLTAYQQSGELPWPQASATDEVAEIRLSNLPLKVTSTSDALDQFIAQVGDHDYVAINAFLPNIEAYQQDLTRLQAAIAAKSGRPVTLGFGPRFLHSTGQLHKGGPNYGLFLVLTQAIQTDLEIPEEGMSFGALCHAQALGDTAALASLGRRVLHLHLTDPDVAALKPLMSSGAGP